MKKIYLSLVGAAAFAGVMPAAAQLPNPGFINWGECIPWTSNGNKTAVGTTPEHWTISNVVGINGMGATAVGTEVDGLDADTKAVALTNNPNPYMAAQIVPGYITLGTSWSTAVGMEVIGGNLANNDGGAFGGLKNETRPDGVYFHYKHTLAEGNTQQATVVAYLWKGTFTQADVPGNIVLTGAPATVDMVNRDRNILGMDTNKGGEVTKSEGAELIAKVIRPIVNESDEWVELTVPFEYVTESVPEMINVIFAANDYFDSQKIEKGNTFTVAAPQLVYWSKLSDLTISGTSVEGFNDAVYTYHVETLPATDEIAFTILGQAATAKVEEKDGDIVITVTNAEGTDEEGLSEHTYTLTTKDLPSAGEAISYEGKLTVEMGGGDITDGGVNATVTITPDADGTCTFLLPNLTLGDLGTIGDIKLEGVKAVTEDGVTTYTGSQEGMKLLGGVITANVTLNGTVDAEGKADMTIDVLWVDANMPIKVVFAGEGKAGIVDIEIDNSNAPVEYFNLRGVRVNGNSLVPGLYIRRQGSETTKIIVR